MTLYWPLVRVWREPARTHRTLSTADFESRRDCWGETRDVEQELRPWVEAQADLDLEPQAEAALERAVSCDAAVFADGLWL